MSNQNQIRYEKAECNFVSQTNWKRLVKMPVQPANFAALKEITELLENSKCTFKMNVHEKDSLYLVDIFFKGSINSQDVFIYGLLFGRLSKIKSFYNDY